MIRHQGTRSIPTQRLCLRKYAVEDLRDIYKNYATDERVTKFLFWQPYTNMESLSAFIAGQISSYAGDVYNWVIEYEQQVVGSISVTKADEKNESCEIGYCLGYAFWNKGIMTEALAAVLEYLFCEVGYHRIFAKHDIENPASGRVLMNCKMVYEGRLREYYLRYDGTYSDALLYSLLSNDLRLQCKHSGC